MNKAIHLPGVHTCTGCGACVNVCPEDALSLEEGYHTFRYPKIDENKCVFCRKCEKVCPVNVYSNNNTIKPPIFAVEAEDDIRFASSSGGCFTVFSHYIINNGGCVFATTMDPQLKVRIIQIDTLTSIVQGQGSKYVQSDTGLTFRETKKELDSGRLVAYFGCPCQISGLKNYLGREYDNLITVDLVCHGVPSQSLFDKYLQEKNKSDISSVSFRDKSHGWRADVMTIDYLHRGRYVRSWKKGDEFEIAFQENLALRDCCENCKFCEFPRVGDITLGDFWGIQKFMRVDFKGTSMMLVNNTKGQRFVDNISKAFKLKKLMNIQNKMLPNRLFRYYRHHKYKTLFFELIKHNSFSRAVHMARSGKVDIAIVGIPTVENFGGALTYAALYKTVKELGYSCLMVERSKDCIHPPTPIERISHHSPYKEHELVSDIPHRSGLAALNDRADTFLVGSDQLFHNNLMNNFSSFAMLDWVSDSKKKLAYAASFGHAEFTGTENRRAEMAHYLQKFDAFAVRENSAVKLAKEEFGVEAVHVVDPVFLCAPEYWEFVAGRAVIDYSTEEYIGAYILDPNPIKERMLRDFSRETGLPLKIYSEMMYNNESIKKRWGLDIETGKIEDRLACIYHSRYFITDSFHGMCFATIFKKDFSAIRNMGRGTARFLSLMGMIGTDSRLIDENDRPKTGKLDYEVITSRLQKEIDWSKKWLREQLSSTTKKAYSCEDVMLKKLKHENSQLRAQVRLLAECLGIGYSFTQDLVTYLRELKKKTSSLAIIVTAKDTPGMSISDEIRHLLADLGIKTSLTREKHWHGYIAVLDRGRNVFEQCEYQKRLEYKFECDGHDVAVVSAPLNAGNESQCRIDNKDYSVNMRGLNFVVYDFEKRIVTDSICFDTHHHLFGATRKQLV